MRALIIVCVLASLAHAGPRTFGSFKLVSEQPALHDNRDLHAKIQPLHDVITACGNAIEGRPILHPTVKLHVAADGSVSETEIAQKNLSDDTVACIRKVFGGVTFPAKKQPAILTLVLVYNH